MDAFCTKVGFMIELIDQVNYWFNDKKQEKKKKKWPTRKLLTSRSQIARQRKWRRLRCGFHVRFLITTFCFCIPRFHVGWNCWLEINVWLQTKIPREHWLSVGHASTKNHRIILSTIPSNSTVSCLHLLFCTSTSLKKCSLLRHSKQYWPLENSPEVFACARWMFIYSNSDFWKITFNVNN